MRDARRVRKRAVPWSEIVGVALLAAGVLLTLALFSHDSEGLSGGDGHAILGRNLAGVIGAYVSSCLLGAVGVSAYLLPPLLLLCSVRRFRASLSNKLPRLAYGIATLFCGSAIAALTDAVPRPVSQPGRGGLAGALVADALVRQLNLTGACVVLIAVTVVGVLLTTDLSLHTLWARLRGALSRRGPAHGGTDIELPRAEGGHAYLTQTAPAADDNETVRAGSDAEALPDPSEAREPWDTVNDDGDDAPLIVRKTAAGSLLS